MTAQEWLEIYDKNYPWSIESIRDAATIIRDQQDKIENLTAELAEVRTYKQVIDDALVVANIGVASGDAKADLHKLLMWEVDVALDPRVSKRAADLLAEKDAEIEQLRKDNHAHCTALMTTAMWEGMEEKLQAAESLAASRLADQEAIERHTRKRVARECAEIAEAMWSDHYWAWPAMQICADKIRKKYGVSNEK